MKRVKNNQDKRKDLGFTLVEVLVAVAILVFAVVPILSSFLSVARVNRTSRQRLAANSVAESTMESVKAFALCDVAYQCGYFDESSFTLLAGDLENKTNFSGTAEELKEDSGTFVVKQLSSELSAGAGGPETFLGNADGKYYFFIGDIPMAGGTYDAIISYEKDASRNNLTFIDPENPETNVSVDSTLQEMDIRVLKYYNVTVKVYRSAGNVNIDNRLAEYRDAKPLAMLTGTKMDYN